MKNCKIKGLRGKMCNVYAYSVSKVYVLLLRKSTTNGQTKVAIVVVAVVASS